MVSISFLNKYRLSYRLILIPILLAGQLAAGITPAAAASEAGVAGAAAPVPALDAGAGHTCARTAAGGVVCWGENEKGQLGNNSTAETHLVVGVSGLSSGVKAVTSGSYYSCALTNLGGVKCWGMNNTGQLGNNTTEDSSIPVDVSGLGSGVSAISAGGSHTCALMVSGGVKCWGSGSLGELGVGGGPGSSPVPLDATGLGSGVSAISAGTEHTCALLTTGGVACWGNNDRYQVGSPTNDTIETPANLSDLSSGVSAISAGNKHTCALMTTGGVKCWGDESNGQLGNNVESDETTYTPVDVQDAAGGSLSGVTNIGAGEYHTCAVASGAVKCWGQNYRGKLGDGTMTNRSAAVTASGLTTGQVSVTGGMNHTCAVAATGVVRCWGANDTFVVGDGTKDLRLTPVYAGTPTSLSPGYDASVSQGKPNVTLKWKLPVFATKKVVGKYHLQTSTDSDFTAILNERVTSGASYVMKNLNPASVYYWRVQALYRDGSSGGYTAYRLNTVQTKAPKPGAPGWNSTQKKALVKFTWSRPAGTPKTGFQYVLQYDTATDFATCENDTFTTCTEVGDIRKTYTSQPLTINSPLQTVYWRVKVTSLAGDVDYSGWSTTKYFIR